MKLRVKVPTRELRVAEFEFWVPKGDNVPRDLKALAVLADGSNSNGCLLAHDKDWQRWAAKNRVGLVGCYLMDKDPMDIEGYADAKVESGAALLWAIREFCNDPVHEQKLRYLEGQPLLMWGFSAGGQFAYEMNAAFPERVGAFCGNKGGIYYTALCQERARRNPGLFFIGQRDAEWRQAVVKGLVAVNNRGGAKWGIVEEPVGHALGESEPLGREFFSSVLATF